ncbi:hypothetical protein NP233_g11281 [Leucocoprinus birnbaumii]|uniref:Uncharacterized protein n=1 Tax=Leucocoprinus birnbaumii TaxID=56174 RepID=A0AAD5VHE1_9AGAR|nr:hypothetical protein NP233_g11281 [Leucocoprinus birnbaumii]
MHKVLETEVKASKYKVFHIKLPKWPSDTSSIDSKSITSSVKAPSVMSTKLVPVPLVAEMLDDDNMAWGPPRKRSRG